LDAPATISFSDCARILLGATKDWHPADGKAVTLANARVALAKLIYALGGDGFPPPASDQLMNDNRDPWNACLAAARSARDANDKPLPPDGRFALLWRPDASNPVGPGLPTNWPDQPNSTLVRIYGPLLDSDNTPKQLFLFGQMDETATGDVGTHVSPGLWLKPPPFAPAAAAQVPLADVAPQRAPRQQVWLATGLFAVWVASFFYLGLWQWVQGDIANRTWKAMEDGIARNAGDPSKACETLTADKKALTWVPECDDLWDKARTAQKPADPSQNDSLYDRAYRHFWTDRPETLLKPFIWTMVATCILLLAAGVGSPSGNWFAALISSRNRFSLERTQQLAWTILLLAALAVTSGFNAILIPTTLGLTLDFIPSMPGALWAALGVSLVASPYLSAMILDAKEQTVEPQAPVQTSIVKSWVTPARLDQPPEASWLDLVTGETQGTENQLDVSRVQHLIITGLLISIYMALLAKLTDSVNPQMIATAFMVKQLPFSQLPQVGETFLGLLLLSHGGYLAFKARKSDDSDAPAGGAAGQQKK
jgi:hypothetical protein